MDNISPVYKYKQLFIKKTEEEKLKEQTESDMDTISAVEVEGKLISILNCFSFIYKFN